MPKVNTLTLTSSDYPEILREIGQPPKQLYILGSITELLVMPRLAVIGSRKVSIYGRQVTQQLVRDAAARGIVIVSGLALGVDGIAHQAAIEAGGKTIAVLPTGLDKIYPASHHQLAKKILETGGALITEYPTGTEPFKTNFIARNRIVSGISDGVLITEAAEKSGTLHTANFALEQGKTVMAVPGNINSPLSAGTNNLIKAGAIPITNTQDIFHALDLNVGAQLTMDVVGATKEESILLELLASGFTESAELLTKSGLDPSVFNQTMTMLEINGKARPLGAGHWTIS
jgi:DNA processing protein